MRARGAQGADVARRTMAACQRRVRAGPVAPLAGGDRLLGGSPLAVGHAGRAQLQRRAAVA